jgi:DNA excision repair protein ERCC-2
VQAAGRLIRSESDRGIIVLMDDRFLSEEFQEALPSDWRAEAFVKSNILSELNDFWSK